MDVISAIYLMFAAISLYFGFFLLILFFENRDRLHENPTPEKLRSVTLIIPAYNEEEMIAGTLKSVINLNYPKNLLEILVIDDGSTDNTASIANDIAKKFDNVKVISKENGGKANSLNFGISHAKGEIVGCVDADSYPTKNSLMDMMGYFNDPKVGAVTSAAMVKNPKNLLQRLQHIEYMLIIWSRKLLEFIDCIYVTPGPLSIYTKDSLIEVGGFDEKILTEDIEIVWGLQEKGYKVRLALSADVYTNVPEKIKQWWKQRTRWAIGGIQTTLKYRYAFFNKDYGTLGLFIVPYFSITLFIGLFGFCVFSYIILKAVFEVIYFNIYSYWAGADVLATDPLILLPNVFAIFGALILVFSLIHIWIGLRIKTGHMEGLIWYFTLAVYILPYLFLFVLVLIYSCVRMAQNKYEW